MPAALRRGWIRDELTQVLSLYCQLPFGQLHARNAAVKALAQALRRTASAVALKLVNFASLDPTLQARGIRGMSNSLVLDRTVWNETFGQWNALAGSIPEQVAEAIVPSTEPSQPPPPNCSPTEVIRETRERIGQRFFRNSVLASYNGRCCITGITSPALLRASHIVPWSVATELRLDPRNGLCLNALHDAAFDRGLITIDSAACLLLSADLKTMMPPNIYADMFARYAQQAISLPEKFQPRPEYLALHRSTVFSG
jgi:putative restriction endonuclease